MRTHLNMNAYRLTTFRDMKAELTNVKQAQSAVMAKTGDAYSYSADTVLRVYNASLWIRNQYR